MDAMALDPDRARQALLADSRIQRASVERRWPHAIVVRIEERQPVLLVRHGEPWRWTARASCWRRSRTASSPTCRCSGPTFEPYEAGHAHRHAGGGAGLAWTRATSVAELELAGQISEIDVSDPRVTALLLMTGTRVACPAWPPDTRRLSSLRRRARRPQAPRCGGPGSRSTFRQSSDRATGGDGEALARDAGPTQLKHSRKEGVSRTWHW